MDIEKVKKNFKWDPSRGDYSKGYVSYERTVQRKKYLRNVFLVALYIILLIAVVVLLFLKFQDQPK